jgi:hypothetical protein
MILERLDNTARGRLTLAEREFRCSSLDGSLEPLRDAHNAVFSMSHLANYREGDHVPLETATLLGNASVPIGGVRVADDYARSELSEDERSYLNEKGYTARGLEEDAAAIAGYRKLVDLAKRGLFLDAEKYLKLSHNEGGLPKPLIASDAIATVISYARDHGEDGLKHYLDIAEGLVREGAVDQSVVDLVYDKVVPYVRALKVFSIHGMVEKILRHDARNRALDRIRVLQEGTPTDGSWVYQQFQEGKKFAEQAGLGLLYRIKLSRAVKESEKRLLAP